MSLYGAIVIVCSHDRGFSMLRLLQPTFKLFYPRFQGSDVASLFASGKLVAGT